ncbi:hypothetical protein AWENTII_000275 [Aspergillus wentii]
MVHLSTLIALAGLPLTPFVSAAANKFTPDDYDWDSLSANDTVASGLWMYSHEAPETTDLSTLSPTHPASVDEAGMQQVAVLAALGWAWRAASVASFGIALKDTIDSCKQTANKDAGVGPCLKGVFGTVMAFGGAASANKNLLHKAGRLVLPNRFLPDGTVDLEMNVLNYNRHARRDAVAQGQHDEFVRYQLRSLSTSEPEFLGYAEEDHRLAKREFATHPLVPMFRFDHAKHGSMEMTTRDTMNGTFVTAAYTGHPTHLLGRRQIDDLRMKMKRQEVYDKETFDQGVLEARFDTEASKSDPASVSADAGKLFDTFEPEVECFMHGEVKDKSILDVQMYDKTNKATFGFGSIGIYKNDDDAHSIEKVTPSGMPLPQCT